MAHSQDIDNCKWFAIATSIAYIFLVLTQTIPVINNAAEYARLFEDFGTHISEPSKFVLKYYLYVSVTIISAAILSAVWVAWAIWVKRARVLGLRMCALSFH